MLQNVSILIPYGPDHGHRDRLFQWTREFYSAVMPEVELSIGQLPDNKMFSRSKGINQAARQATKDIFVIADGDIIYDPAIIIEAVRLLDKYTWILPVQKAFDLTKESTEKLLQTGPEWPIPMEVSYTERKQVGSGLLNIIPRRHFETIGGFDERFAGWGGEDDAFSISMTIMCGAPERLNFTVHHLWHPSADMSNYGNNIQLLNRYCQGRESIKQLIKERKGSD
jgi:hypothetical protein